MRARHWIEYGALRFGLALFRTLPPRASVGLARGLAALWYRLDRRRRETAQHNLRQSGIASTPAEAARLARASFVHFGAMFAETLKHDPERPAQRGQVRVIHDIHPDARALLEKPGQGLILVSGHFGNWEIAAQQIGKIKPVAGIAKSMKNPHADRLVKSVQTRKTFQLIPMHDADVGRFFTVIASGKILALLTDQYAKFDKVMVDFFGVPASTHASPALLHLVTRAPICFGVCRREGLMQYRLEVGPPLIHAPTGNRRADVRAILENINARLEQVVREHPEQYLWAHRRWRHVAAPTNQAQSAQTGGNARPPR